MIRLVVLDVDGCLSDGKIVYDASGCESKSFNVKDGLAIKSYMQLGYRVAIITGRDSTIVQKRAAELGIEHLYQGVKDKATILKSLCATLKIDLCEVAAIGDDLNDAKMLQIVGRSFAPKDAASYILQHSDVVLDRVGGDACVRQMIELILRESGEYDKFVALWT